MKTHRLHTVKEFSITDIISMLRISMLKISAVSYMLVSIPLTSMFLSGCNQAPSDIKADVSASTTTQNEFCNFTIQPFAHTICEVKQERVLNQALETDSDIKLSLFWRKNNDNINKSIEPYKTFDPLITDLSTTQNSLVFAVNAGMYNQDFAPIGYTVINNEQILSLNLNEGAGNFHLMPNGVFWWDKTGFYVTESNQMQSLLDKGLQASFATQSGPMLVINNNIHPKFKKESTSKKLRNGVGVCTDGHIKFINSQVPVNFYEFANLYKNLGCDNALFLDGGVASALYSTELNEHDKKSMGVMVGLIKSKSATKQ